MTSKELLRNISTNVAGQLAPLIVAAFAIPQLIDKLGVDRFGLLTLIWIIVGYFSIFDFGLGRALTKSISEKLGRGELEKIPQLITNGLMLMLVLGCIGGGTLFAAYQGYSARLDMEPTASQELDKIALWVSISIPAVIFATGLRGILEAYQLFGIVNLVRVPLGIWTYLGPLLVVAYRNDLSLVVAALLIGRWLTTLLFIPCVISAQEWQDAPIRISKHVMTGLFRFGGWLTVTNVISPLMTYLDRFVVSAVLGAGIVAYYTTPYEVISKLVIIPEAALAVVFPLLAKRLAADTHVNSSYRILNAAMAQVMTPIVALCIVFAESFFSKWISADFSSQASTIFQILAAGLFVNSLSRIPYNLIQASGDSKTTAIVHIIELPIYLTALYLLLNLIGLPGAAIAWMARMVVDNLVLGHMASKAALVSRLEYKTASGLAIFSLTLLLLGMVVKDVTTAAIWFCVACLFCSAFAWFKVLNKDDRRRLQDVSSQILKTKPI